MSDPFRDDEPLPDHLADTGPVRSIREARSISVWRHAVGFLSLLGAAALTIATVLLIVAPQPAPQPVSLPTDIPVKATLEPTSTLVPQPTVSGETIQTLVVLPTLDPNQMPALLSTPMQAADGGAIRAVRNVYNPYTIIPERTRSEVEPYTVVSGDTIFTIAERYGLKPETIIWGNDHSLVDGLRPGRVINILPVDGVYYTVQKEESIAAIAKKFIVDPYTIIDADYNSLFAKKPDDTLPSGTHVVIPGGQREAITWTPVVERVAGSGAGGAGAKISFAPGDSGSCGLVANPGGNGGWSPPLTTAYTWMRGFSGVHSGVDLSTPTGTPVHAAQGGTVIFAGWSSWGYGYTVVLAHGAFTTLYGHLNSVGVGCGQSVGSGQVIAYSGSSGNSTGPHLHFEIRYLDVPQDPTYTLGF